jgi:NAD(P)-dependent dehydrogenase (short-subunit alcohol dehydrogenase family)
VAACDVNAEGLAESVARASAGATAGATVTGHDCDVADAEAVGRFRDEVVAQHGADHVDLVFNNAGVGGGSSFLASPREEWDRTFAICWGGVYHCARAFVPLLVASDEGWLVNTSSVNGFLATVTPRTPNTAYSTAKFAIKGFSEALIEDLRVNAPHVRVAVVMPGHVGTDILLNSRRIHQGTEPEAMPADEVASVRERMVAAGMPGAAEMDDDQVRAGVRAFVDGFRDSAPMSAAQAATVILDGVRAGEWRILVGEDAEAFDAAVRADPLAAYAPEGILATLLR